MITVDLKRSGMSGFEIEGMEKRVVRSDFFFFSSRRRHTRLQGDWSSDVCSSDLHQAAFLGGAAAALAAVIRAAVVTGHRGPPPEARGAPAVPRGRVRASHWEADGIGRGSGRGRG